MFLASCSTIKEGFENQKKNSSDEFKVEKKSPLVMPPNYEVLPLPDDNKNAENSKKKISNKELLKATPNKDKHRNTAPALVRDPGDVCSLSAIMSCPDKIPKALNIKPALAIAI